MKPRILATLFLLSSLSVDVGSLLHGQQPVQRELRPELDRKLSEIAARGHLPGFAVSIVTRDGVLFQNGYGYADIERKVPYTPGSLQNIGSISKTFIGVSLMQLVEKDRIRMEDDINRYLPFKVVNPYFPNEPIVIRHLATHSSTLQDTEEFWLNDYFLEEPVPTNRRNVAKVEFLRPGNKRMPLDQFIRNIVTTEGVWYRKSNFLKQKPGMQFQYSNLGAALAAYIVERVTAESFADYTDKHILKPIGMSDSAWLLEKIDRDRYATHYMRKMQVVPLYSFTTYPDGGLIASVEDLSKYLMEMIRGYQGESKLLRKESFRAMMSPPWIASGTTGYGMFWTVLKDGIGHSGGDPGITTSMFFNPSNGIGIIVFTNYTFADKISEKTFSDIRNVLASYSERL